MIRLLAALVVCSLAVTIHAGPQRLPFYPAYYGSLDRQYPLYPSGPYFYQAKPNIRPVFDHPSLLAVQQDSASIPARGFYVVPVGQPRPPVNLDQLLQTFPRNDPSNEEEGDDEQCQEN